jgi:hypothetical protein
MSLYLGLFKYNNFYCYILANQAIGLVRCSHCPSALFVLLLVDSLCGRTGKAKCLFSV